MSSKTSFVVGLVITVVGGFIAYQAFISPDTSASPQVAGATTNSGHLALAPDFTLEKLDGGKITLSDYRGDKPVILDFWTTWCPNCQRDMPVVSRLYEKYRNQVEIIGVNMRESSRVAQGFVSSRNILFPIVMDSGRVANQYGIRYTNTHVLIDKNGSIVQTVPGDLRESHVLSLIQ